MDSFHPANAHNADQSGDTRILSGTIWRGAAAYSHSHSSVPHSIEDSGVRRVGQPSPLLRKHGLSVYRGNAQPASTRSSAAPTRHGRVIGATKSVHRELGSLPCIVIPVVPTYHRWSSLSYWVVQSNLIWQKLHRLLQREQWHRRLSDHVGQAIAELVDIIILLTAALWNVTVATAHLSAGLDCSEATRVGADSPL